MIPEYLRCDSRWRTVEEWEIARERRRLVEGHLTAFCNRQRIDAMAFYLACDPFMPGLLRCLASSGVDFPEACSHFRHRPMPVTSESAFYPNATKDPLRSGGDDDPRVTHLVQQGQLLFGDFVTREQIVSRGWFIRRDESGRAVALLTVNFQRAVTVEEWDGLASRLAEEFAGLVERADQVRGLLQERSDALVPAFLHMLDALDTSRSADAQGSTRDPWKRLLSEAVKPLDGPDRQWCGTVHQLNASGQSLDLVASLGDFTTPPRTRLDVTKGEGVISWVALRQQAVRIKDLADSKIGKLSVPYRTGMVSQLAVPILLRGKVWGTLSLETNVRDFFRVQEVGYFTRVATLAAMLAAQQGYEQVCQERDLYLESAYEAQIAEALKKPLPSFEELMRTAIPATSVISQLQDDLNHG